MSGDVLEYSLITEHDVTLFREGTHFKIYEKLGAHPLVIDGASGAYFAVWAPNATEVYVVGDFNEWRPNSHRLIPRKDGSGIWEGFIKGVRIGSRYKYYVVSRNGEYRVFKGDPYAYLWEKPPKTASVIWDLSYEWRDDEWLRSRKARNSYEAPVSIYEVHLGSWRRRPDEGNRFLSYRELADELCEYLVDMSYTHVEFLPVMEHPFYGSWGYQVTGYYAPTSRYGKPQDFMYLVDKLHRHGIGVVLDWVPSHFATDEHGLVFFDGTCLYEYEDWRKRSHPDWGSHVFDYSKGEVRSFLISNALFWIEKYHVDGLRMDAVASMLYLDYSRKPGEWTPNPLGGRENLEAVDFVRTFNKVVHRYCPGVLTIAEESSAWPKVSRPVENGGLGFDMKWNMGWMHDTLYYMSKDPIYRKYHHDILTFNVWYVFYENFINPLSHDEVVHGKKSLVRKMPGDDWQKFANLRLLYGYMYAHPGKKMLFMGNEIAQWDEWDHERGVDWHLLKHPEHRGVQAWVRDLNLVYVRESALHELDFSHEGFEWVDFRDREQSVIAFLRKGSSGDLMLVVLNFTPVVRSSYRVGVPRSGFWEELLNSDLRTYGGSGVSNAPGVMSENIPYHERPYSLVLTLPPLAAVFLKHRERY
ncbi:MAG: 1,4-alpha-glucan branching protein GlgB [Zestosphaera sp.]